MNKRLFYRYVTNIEIMQNWFHYDNLTVTI